MSKTKTAIIGASGYSGEELVGRLLTHPHAELTAVTSRQYAGQTVAEIFPRFSSVPAARRLVFEEPDAFVVATKADIVFLALPHGVAAEYATTLLEKDCKVIDLSADFRLNDADHYREFYHSDHPAPHLMAEAVYGLPEIYREEIKKARLIANPGCYPTSILLPIIPLIREGIIKTTGIIANSMSAVTGAGRKLDIPYLFGEVNESVRPYGVPKHRHLSEIEQELSLAANDDVTIQFSPHLLPINRGIQSTLYLAPAKFFASETEAEAISKAVAAAYQKHYAGEIFIRILGTKGLPDTKNVAFTNFVEIAWRVDPRTGRLLVFSAEDNIVKGASGQAIQNFNLLVGCPEESGL